MSDNHVAAIYDFAKKQGYKVQSFSTQARHNRKGAYTFVELALVIPTEEDNTEQPKSLEEHIAELETDLHMNQGYECPERRGINNEI